jgi:hypothetical protein
MICFIAFFIFEMTYQALGLWNIKNTPLLKVKIIKSNLFIIKTIKN